MSDGWTNHIKGPVLQSTLPKSGPLGLSTHRRQKYGAEERRKKKDSGNGHVDIRIRIQIVNSTLRDAFMYRMRLGSGSQCSTSSIYWGVRSLLASPSMSDATARWTCSKISISRAHGRLAKIEPNGQGGYAQIPVRLRHACVLYLCVYVLQCVSYRVCKLYARISNYLPVNSDAHVQAKISAYQVQDGIDEWG